MCGLLELGWDQVYICAHHGRLANVVEQIFSSMMEDNDKAIHSTVKAQGPGTRARGIDLQRRKEAKRKET